MDQGRAEVRLADYAGDARRKALDLLGSIGDDEEVLPAAGREELGARAVSGARWLVAGQGVTEVVALASTIALARLVSPTEYGYAAAAIIFPTLAEVLLDQGFGLSLVRRADATRRTPASR